MFVSMHMCFKVLKILFSKKKKPTLYFLYLYIKLLYTFTHSYYVIL